MERKIPKNVRQIGNVSDSLKIYVEDYVDTYLNQLCEKDAEDPVGAFLIGEIVKEDELEYQYIYGAVQMNELSKDGDDITVSEETWKDACETCKAFFDKGEIIGWFAAIPGIPFAINSSLKRVHHGLFSKTTGIFIMKDPVCKEDMYFAPKFNDLMQTNGHYIYYEKNPSMQNYMISSRKKIGVTPSEVVADRAAKSFRNLVQTKMVQQEKKQINKFAYSAGVLLALVILIIGVTTINNYDRMRSVQEAMEAMSESVAAGKDEGQAAENEISEEQQELKEPEQTDKAEGTEQKQDQKETDTESKEKKEGKETKDQEENEKEKDKKAPSDKEDDAALNGGWFYIVEEGDTLAGISKKAYGDFKHVDAISRINGLENGNLIYVGQKLLLP